MAKKTERQAVLQATISSLSHTFVTPWFVMLAIGILHHAYPVVPSLAYWHTFLALFIVRSATTQWLIWSTPPPWKQ